MTDKNPKDRSRPTLERWQTPTQCRKCKDVIWSKFQGDFVTCKCGAISVDQTKYYSRYIGNREDFVGLDNENT